MQKNPLKITCPKCLGCGEISLTHRLTETLAIVRSRPGHAWTKEDVQSKTPAGSAFTTPAIWHRLKDLVKLGYIIQRREGSQLFYYSEIPKSKAA